MAPPFSQATDEAGLLPRFFHVASVQEKHRQEKGDHQASSPFSEQLGRVACFPLDKNAAWSSEGETCTVCGKQGFGRAYFSRAY